METAAATDDGWDKWAKYILREIESSAHSIKALGAELKENSDELKRLGTSFVMLSSSGRSDVIQKEVENLRENVNDFKAEKRKGDDTIDKRIEGLKTEILFEFEKAAKRAFLEEQRMRTKIDSNKADITKLLEFKAKAMGIWAFSTFAMGVAISIIGILNKSSS
jgi:hypothetical protein